MTRSTSRAALTLALALAGGDALAQKRRVSLDVELGGGTLLHDFDHDGLTAATGALWSAARVRFALVGPLSVHLGAGYGRFFRPHRDLPLVAGLVGMRVAPSLGGRTRLWVDVEGGAFAPGSVVRPGVTAGLGLDIDLAPAVSLGPYARFTHIFDGRAGVGTAALPYAPSANQDTADVHGWTAGIAVSLHFPTRPRAPQRPEGSPP